MSTKTYFTLFFLVIMTSCTVFTKAIPQPKREFRGVWIATVANIDWPKNGADAVAKQKEDYLNILDYYNKLHFNAVIVQIRTAGDAFYPSAYAPWSRFLTGTEGEAKEDHPDLLSWMILEAHKRGFEFHAWLNPYRATFDENIEVLSASHDYFQHPEWMLKYGKKNYYNPGLPKVQNHLAAIIKETLDNYDIDAIHFDDYFYPYKIKGEIFQDSLAYRTYARPNQSVDNWRRANIDSLVKKVHATIKSTKPWVQFGISPFGVWKNNNTDPKGSDTRAGQTTYEDLYADPILWMEKGWIDYLAPQIYWSLEYPPASHRKLIKWWGGQPKLTNLYVGNGVYKIRNNADKAWKKKKEVPNQLKLSRQTSNIDGNIFFSAKSLMQDHKDVVNYMKRKYYRNIALPPTSMDVQNHDPFKTLITDFTETKEAIAFNIDASDITVHFALIYRIRKKDNSVVLTNKKPIAKVYLNAENKHRILKREFQNKKHIALTFADRYERESEPIVVHLKYDQKR